jgi:ankyrin repeat protein
MCLNESLKNAVAEKNLNEVKRLIEEGAEVNQVNEIDKTPLIFWTLWDRSGEILKEFIKAGADFHNVQASEYDVHGLLTEATLYNNLSACIELVKEGINVNNPVYNPDDTGLNISPLFAACQIGNLFLVRLFIISGANVNQLDYAGSSVLMEAVKAKHFEIVRELLLSNANITLIDQSNKTAIDYAKDCENQFIYNMLVENVNGNDNYNSIGILNYVRKGQIHKIREFTESGATLEVKDDWGYTPLMEAIITNSSEIVKMLIRAGADVNAHDDTGNTPLHIATKSQIFWMVELLLENGANVNFRNFTDEQTPLILACRARDEQIINLLLMVNSDPTLEDKNKIIAWEYASSKSTKILRSFFSPYSRRFSKETDKLLFTETWNSYKLNNDLTNIMLRLERHASDYGVEPLFRNPLLTPVAQTKSSGCLTLIIIILLFCFVSSIA